MHPLDHAKSSAKKWGGAPEEYMHIHQWLDAPKEVWCDWRHRAVRHHSFGIFEAERTFGVSFKNSVGRDVLVRYVCEQHIKEDCGGYIPSLQDWLEKLPRQNWMACGYKLSDNEYEGQSMNEVSDG